MKKFIHKDFLLHNDTAVTLYHDYAQKMPIIDYHCHLDPKEIALNKQYRNITEVWLGGDHYKWRAMRANGVDERFITGDAPDKEKFMKWAETMPYLIGNPLYHWTHLELKRYFGINTLLCPETAESIWEHCNELLKQPEFSAQGIIRQSRVKAICTTDDPADTLEYHQMIKEDPSIDFKVLPTFRPDKAVNLEKKGYKEYIEKLGQAAGVDIKSLKDLYQALDNRLQYFHEMGCRISDHAVEPPVYEAGGDTKADAAFRKAAKGEHLTLKEINLFKTRLMLFFGRKYAELGWAMQLHIGAQRDNNTRMFKQLGPNTGYDAMADYHYSEVLAKYLDALEKDSNLPKTILYTLNPISNEMLVSLAGCFQGGIPGKIQFGSAWWFMDQKDGMLQQMRILASNGLLSRFVGMLTDSRSFLSYTRHEYFRRILSNLLGSWVEQGEAPDDMELLGRMVQDISYNNALNYFKL